MKNDDDEVQKSVDETAALIREVAGCLEAYKESVRETIRKCAEELIQNIQNSSSKDELGALARSLEETATVIKRHMVQMQRTLKVVTHKNEAHANDRLFAALERMNRASVSFQEKWNAAKAKLMK